MVDGVIERDWRAFRELREVALERFCDRVLDELQSICSEPSRTPHERYLALCQTLGERNAKVAEAFDNPRRSHMLRQLAVIHSLGLLQPTEWARFTEVTRDAIVLLVDGLAE